MATASQIMDELHRIREKDAERYAELGPAEYLRQLEARVSAVRERLGIRASGSLETESDECRTEGREAEKGVHSRTGH